MATLAAWPDPAKPRTIAWEDLLFPLVPGATITRGYTLSPPRRGEERDVVFAARRDDPATGAPVHVEVHIVDKGQWSGIRETRSFGVAYETPRSNAPVEDLEAVTEVIANHLRSNDIGDGSVENIPLRAEPSLPWISRMLARTQSFRGTVAILLLVLSFGFVASIPQRGDTWAAGLLFLLGLGLRLPHLDVPFTHDQDVQRFFTGQYALREILTGHGLDDRHPPLWFVVLHVAGLFGQTELIARLPAALAGAAIGPAIVWASKTIRGSAGPAGAWCGLLATLSPELVRRSREVSEIPLFALLVVLAIGLAARLSRASSASTKRSLAIVTALLAWTYYLTPLVILGLVVPLAWTRRLKKDVRDGLAWGLVAGAPALVLGVQTIARDLDARRVAEQFPTLAWGQHTPLETLARLVGQTVDAVGISVVIGASVAAVVALRRSNDPEPAMALGVAGATTLGISLVSPIARIQPYYLLAVLPVVPLAMALGPSSRAYRSVAWNFFCAASVWWFAHTSLPGAGLAYVPDNAAFMPDFASFVLKRPERQIVVAAHYDATLLSYYLERMAGGRTRWPDVEASGDLVLPASKRRIVPLAHVHALDDALGQTSRNKLLRALEVGPALVIERDAFVLPRVHEELTRCEVLLVAPAARLVRCALPLPTGR